MWYFRFGGTFTSDAKKFAGEGVFSSCIVPHSRRSEAKREFHLALKEANIELHEILETFPLNPDELDPQDESNALWIQWCNKAKESQQIEFDIWHLYDLSNEDEGA